MLHHLNMGSITLSITLVYFVNYLVISNSGVPAKWYSISSRGVNLTDVMLY